MKFAHIRVSEYFAFAKQILHSEAISLGRRANFAEKKSKSYDLLFFLVETVGIEPMTSCMSSMRSNQLSYASATDDIIAHLFPFVNRFSKSFLKKFRGILKIQSVLKSAPAGAFGGS